MKCELCGGPGPVEEYGLADGDIALCAACMKKAEPSRATPDCGCLFDPKTGKQVAVGTGCVDARTKPNEPEVF